MIKQVIFFKFDSPFELIVRCRHFIKGGWSNWKDYKLGYEIYDGYEYRKVEVWYVLEDRHSNNFLLQNHKGDLIYNPIRFEGSKEACEKWIEEHTKKTWLEEILKEKRKSSTVYTRTELDMYELGCEDGIVEVCKKILEKVRSIENRLGSIVFKDVEDIIKDLGVEID